MINLFNVKNLIGLLLIAALILNPFVAAACSMCQAGATEEYILAYKTTTAILVLIPLTTVAVLGIWIYKRYRTM